jgi:hypothetical protein
VLVRRELLVHGLRVAILNNATAYGFSVMITTVFVATQTLLAAPQLGELFLFAGGTTIAFAAVEAVATSGFRVRTRPDRSDVVAVGTALATVSVLLALAVGAGLASLVGGWFGWFLAPFGATVTYSAASGVEMALAHREQARRDQHVEEPEGRSGSEDDAAAGGGDDATATGS